MTTDSRKRIYGAVDVPQAHRKDFAWMMAMAAARRREIEESPTVPDIAVTMVGNALKATLQAGLRLCREGKQRLLEAAESFTLEPTLVPAQAVATRGPGAATRAPVSTETPGMEVLKEGIGCDVTVRLERKEGKYAVTFSVHGDDGKPVTHFHLTNTCDGKIEARRRLERRSVLRTSLTAGNYTVYIETDTGSCRFDLDLR